MSGRASFDTNLDIEKSFDIIGGLYSRYMLNVLELLFGKLDEGSLRNAELVSKTWKTAVSGVNPAQFWNKFLGEKATSSSVWNTVHYNLVQANSQHNPRKLYNQIQFAVQSIEKNWLNCDFTRDFIDSKVGLESDCVFQCNSKFISMWEPTYHVFKIWNRHSLKLEEVYHVGAGEDQCKIEHYQLYENALIFIQSDLIYIRNLTTKKTNEFKPPQLAESQSITFFRTENDILYAAVSPKFRIDNRHDFIVWKMKTPTDIDWKNGRVIPSIDIANARIFVDHSYLITAHYYSSQFVCNVQGMSAAPEKKKGPTIRLRNCLRPSSLFFHNGFLVMATKENEIKFVDVESGVLTGVLQTNLDFSSGFTMSLRSDLLFVCSSIGCLFFPTQIRVWDFKEAKNSSADSPVQPFCSFETFIEPGFCFEIDAFGVVTARCDEGNDEGNDEDNDEGNESTPSRASIRTLNFLPTCNFCKSIKQNLTFCCIRCKSAKYCSSKCERSDWEHHRKLCTVVREVSSRHELEAVFGNTSHG